MSGRGSKRGWGVLRECGCVWRDEGNGGKDE